MFSFGEVGKKCHVKSVLRVHDPMFYWKVLFLSHYSGPILLLALISHVTRNTFFRLQLKQTLAWQTPTLMVISLS